MNIRRLLLILLCSFSLNCYAQDSSNASVMPTGELPVDKEAALLKSIFSAAPLEYPALLRKRPPQGLLYDVWKGSESIIDIGVKAVKLSFVPGPSAKAKEQPPLDLTFKFEKNGIRFVHSKGNSATLRRGFMLSPIVRKNAMRGGGKTFWNEYFQSTSGPDVALFVPSTMRAKQKGLLACLRTIGDKTETLDGIEHKSKVYSEADYTLTNVDYTVEGYIEGSFSSTISRGIAKARLYTTENVFACSTPSDEVYSTDPSVALSYYFNKDVKVDTAFKGDVIGGGIGAQLIFQNKAGYKKDEFVRSMVWVKKITTEKELPVHALFGEITAAPGACYLVIVDKSIDTKYTKEALDIPEAYREKEES